MDESKRNQLEARLLAERERAVKAVQQLDDEARTDDDGELSNLPLHLADEGTDAMEAEKALLLLSQEGRQLNEIDEALRRLYRTPDTFGRCERCNAEIVFERLDLIPWARYCMDCQNALEAATNDGAGTDTDPDAPGAPPAAR